MNGEFLMLLPGPGVYGAVVVEGLDRGRVGSLTLGAVTCPKQGLLVLTIICKGREGSENVQSCS